MADGAKSVSDPQSLADAANAFYQVQMTLSGVQKALNDQANALAGDDGPWKGDAANEFLDIMDTFSKQVKANVDVDGGDVTYAIRIRGTFSGRRTGDAVAVPVPEPDPSPEIAVESATNDAAASTPGSRGAVPAVADAMRVVTAAH